MKKILLIDNFDSFTYNLFQLIAQNFSGEIIILRNNENDKIARIKDKMDAFVISPGPKTPKESGYSLKIVKEFYQQKPIFGVCLGMQTINEVFGGTTIRAPYPMHGKKFKITASGTGVFKNLPQEFFVARYHSLILNNISNDFEINATTFDKIPMGIRHKKYPIHAVQFHPESFMTEFGNEMINNFLELI